MYKARDCLPDVPTHIPVGEAWDHGELRDGTPLDTSRAGLWEQVGG